MRNAPGSNRRRRTARRRLCTAFIRSASLAAIATAATSAAGVPLLPFARPALAGLLLCAGSLGLLDAAAQERRRRPRTARAVARLSGLIGGAGVPVWIACIASSLPPSPAGIVALAAPSAAGVVILLGGLAGKPAQSASASAALLAAGAVAVVAAHG